MRSRLYESFTIFIEDNSILLPEGGWCYSKKKSNEFIAEATFGSNLVDGEPTWKWAEEHKDDLEVMKRCCDAELITMKKCGLVPAPYYFERVAILSRKNSDYRQEIFYCEQYIKMVEDFYIQNGTLGIADVRESPRFKRIVKRLQQAKKLYAKQISL